MGSLNPRTNYKLKWFVIIECSDLTGLASSCMSVGQDVSIPFFPHYD